MRPERARGERAPRDYDFFFAVALPPFLPAAFFWAVLLPFEELPREAALREEVLRVPVVLRVAPLREDVLRVVVLRVVVLLPELPALRAAVPVLRDALVRGLAVLRERLVVELAFFVLRLELLDELDLPLDFFAGGIVSPFRFRAWCPSGGLRNDSRRAAGSRRRPSSESQSS